MAGNTVDREHKGRIDRVIDYISGHLDHSVNLETLARVANYSPFHLQKVFKQLTGDSPKQYGLKLRLETAFHLLIIHPQRSIREISIDCGFSSPAVFSRAIKTYFRHSPEQIRGLPHKAQIKIMHGTALNPAAGQPSAADGSSRTGKIDIQTIKRESLKGIYLMAPFDDAARIRQAFATLAGIARSYDFPLAQPAFYGILCPHQRNTYKAFLPLNPDTPGAERFNITEIQRGNFARFTVRGALKETNKAIHYFYRVWLPASGYKIAGVAGFEIFTGHPAFTPYDELEREVHIPIEPSL